MKPTIKQIKLLVNKILVINFKKDEEKLISNLYSGNKIVSFVNAHALNISVNNNDFLESLLKSNFILRDGIGMKILFFLLKKKSGLNMNGTDFIPKILAFKKNKIALFGTTDATIDLVVQRLKLDGHDVVTQLNGFENEILYLDLINHHQPNLILLGMGMPKQELLASKIIEKINYNNCLIINGGAIIDFLSGKIDRAPLWMRKFGLEWFYRFLKEPKRLFKRYLIGNFIFFINVFKLLRQK